MSVGSVYLKNELFRPSHAHSAAGDGRLPADAQSSDVLSSTADRSQHNGAVNTKATQLPAGVRPVGYTAFGMQSSFTVVLERNIFHRVLQPRSRHSFCCSRQRDVDLLLAAVAEQTLACVLTPQSHLPCRIHVTGRH